MPKRLQFMEDETPPESPPETPPEKPKPKQSRVKKIESLEYKSERHKERLDAAQDALPTKKKKTRKLIYDEQKGKAKSKLVFEEAPIPIGDRRAAGDSRACRRGAGAARKVGALTTKTIANKAHAAVYRTEHENVGTKAAHRGELVGESAYRSGKRHVRSAYRYHKNRPYRKVSRMETKSAKTNAKLSYQKAMQDAPKKKGAMSRFYQKRAIKRKYAAARKAAKHGGTAAKQSVGFTAKVSKLVTSVIRKNPFLVMKVAAVGLAILLVVGMVSMFMGLFPGIGGFTGMMVYAADYEDIDDAELAYVAWTVDLLMELQRGGYDFNSNDLTHCPFELMAYLTAAHGEFIFAEIEPVLWEVFDAQYRLDEALEATPLTDVLRARMTDEQYQHFNILMLSRGARQFVGSPFGFNWLPYVSSRYGYRIHPISGARSFHTGIDIALSTGTEILAGFDGVVARIGYDARGYGNFVVIDNGEGVQALYAHCHEVFVSQGQRISQGDVIATVGSTGMSTGPHLHMEVFRHGQRLNPLFFVQTLA